MGVFKAKPTGGTHHFHTHSTGWNSSFGYLYPHMTLKNVIEPCAQEEEEAGEPPGAI